MKQRAALGLFLVVVLARLPAGSADERRIFIYASSATYSLPVTDREGREYIGLLELLEPLGSVSSKIDGSHWKLRFNDADADFTQGRDRAKVRGKEVALFRPFLMENGRGLVPVSALSSLLPRLIGGPVNFNEPSRRLFVGTSGTRFTADLSRANPTRLILNFSAPVNPTIATEPGRLRMTFRREPVVSAVPVMRFDDPVIPSANFSDANGIAELDINSTAPVMASFSNENKTITITPISQSATGPQAPAASAVLPTPTPTAPQAPNLPPTSAPIPVARHYVVVIDASHGGDDHGVTLTPTLLEKDVTLSLARRLRQELENRGVSALVIRDSDATLTADQRAIFANTAHPVIYVAIHAASDGHGVRLYTSLLPAGAPNNGPFTSWDNAQFPYMVSSANAAVAVAAELRRKQIPNRTLLAPLRPLNNVATAAIALEVAPIGTNIGDLASPPFQQSLAAILADGLASARAKLEASR